MSEIDSEVKIHSFQDDTKRNQVVIKYQIGDLKETLKIKKDGRLDERIAAFKLKFKRDAAIYLKAKELKKLEGRVESNSGSK